MTTFIGYSTIDRPKGCPTLTDFDLIKRDLSNALHIQLGEIVGRPGYGTNIWSYIFEPQTAETERAIQAEIQRIMGGDPRLYLESIEVYPQDNGMLLEVLVQVVPSLTSERLSIFFDQQTRRASFI